MSKSRNEASKAVYRGIGKFKHAIFSEIKCAYIARLVKYYPSKHVADIQPLADTSDGQQSAQYLEVPVAQSCYMFDELIDKLSPVAANRGVDFSSKHQLRKGATVVAVVLDRDNDNWNGSASTYMPNSSRMHDANDSVVISILGGGLR